MGEWAVIHVVELISTMATGANWAMSASHGDKCGPSRSSRAATVGVRPTVVLGTPPCHLVIGGHGGNLPWSSYKGPLSHRRLEGTAEEQLRLYLMAKQM